MPCTPPAWMLSRESPEIGVVTTMPYVTLRSGRERAVQGAGELDVAGARTDERVARDHRDDLDAAVAGAGTVILPWRRAIETLVAIDPRRDVWREAALGTR